MKIGSYLAAIGLASLALVSTANANDIYVGRRGPTTTQLDMRLSYSHNDKGIETTTVQPIVKYWNGDQHGLWCFVSTPYSFVNYGKHGTGDLTAGAGPRGRTGPFNWVSYGALTVPTSETSGNDRFDTRFGIHTTTMFYEGQYNFNASAEYAFTGRNRQGINPPNELSGGCVTGVLLSKRLMVGAGLTALRRDTGDHRENVRLIGRYNFSPKFHLVLIGDDTVSERNIPGVQGLTLIGRYNF